MRTDRTGRAAAAVIAAAGVMLELALLLHWRGGGDRIISTLATPDRDRALAPFNDAYDGWTVHPLAGVLLGLLGAAALVFALLVFRRRRPAVAFSWLLALAAAGAIAYCVALLLDNGGGESDYILRGYGATSYEGVFAGIRPEHGAGVILALVAGTVLFVAAAASALRPRPVAAAAA